MSMFLVAIPRLVSEQNIYLWAVFTTQAVKLSISSEAFAHLIKCVRADPMCYSSSLNSAHKAPSIWISSPAKPDHQIWTKHPGAAYGHSCFPMSWAKWAFVFILRIPWFFLSADVWFGSSAIFQLHILHRPLCPCLFHYSNDILITFPLSQMANNSIKPQFSLCVWIAYEWIGQVGLMQIILQQICSGISEQLAEMRMMQRCSFELMPRNERWILVLVMCWHLNWYAQRDFFMVLPRKGKQVGVCHLYSRNTCSA